ncbi:hypothetical protein KUTeg_020709 [Tegillarca granosa]|uniref:CB1 cannabinoid receptor-interacting protein 1 n=1 Tax=Tegillarca granosa TaxID=220873 RepID=A0ABQ9EDU6_TEGGR|nr:hypothetical protein KUTeg_020709 [Tegillarca granosa]
MAKSFKLSLLMRKKSGDAIYHKQDGQRFDNPHTIKLNINTEYNVRIEIRPPLHLNNVIIHGERFEPKMDEKKSKDDDTLHAYEMSFNTTNYEMLKRGKRKELPLVFELEKGLTMSVQLQCKFYPETEKEHSKWGSALTMLEYECYVPESQTFVDIKREKYL